MTGLRIQINIALVGISTSYLTLGLASSEVASSLWWVYGIASGGLSALNLLLAHREHKNDSGSP